MKRRSYATLALTAAIGLSGCASDTDRNDPKFLLVAPQSGHYATLLRPTVERLLPEGEGVGGRVAQVRPASEAARVEGRVHALGPEQPQHLGDEGRLHERLAARDGHTTAGFIEEDPVTQQRRHQRLRLHALAHALERPGGARLHVVLVAIVDDRVVEFALGAAPAAHAEVPQADKFRRGRLALRVVAPGAAERAALHEDRGAHAGAIVDREALHVEDEAGPHQAS